MHAITEMNQRLNKLNQIFSETTQYFVCNINLHQGKFTQKDFNDFDNLIASIKQQVNQKIQQFFEQKHEEYSHYQQQKITKYTQSAQELQCELFSFRTELEKRTLLLKEQEQRNEVILDHFSRNFYLNTLKKRYLWGFKKNMQICKQQSHVYSEAVRMYRKNLIKKVFLPWRSLTYKSGYQHRIMEQTQHDIQNIHSQYSSIIAILKQKIMETEQLTKIKKAAKNEFSYALSKNLMKTISNLSLEVMSLNQISLRDEECGRNEENERFMREVDRIVDEKFLMVQQYKQSLVGQASERQSGDRQRRIRFA